ncbi:hypothetical protein BJ742DRAFT_775732 [Cladochytrium replicatum]|nr:hypothetical protein BJ742DRAFT_775732 [Cladochytrium replicatum]
MLPSTSVQPKAQGRNPHLKICYLCGREFGSQSIGIHEKACMEKWEKNNASLPKSKRRSRPVRPADDIPIQAKGAGGGLGAGEGYNDRAFQNAMEVQRVPCDVCGRKFNEDRLDVHKRACKPGGLFDKNSSGPKGAAKTTKGGKVELKK